MARTRTPARPRPRKRRGTPQQRQPRGVYKRCRRGALGWRACTGEVVVNGVSMRHTPCGGDGWIKVGTVSGSGRAPRGRRGRAGGRPPRRHRTWRQRKAGARKVVRRQVRTVATGGGVALAAYVVAGTVGLVVVGTLLALVLVLAVRTRVRRLGGAR